MKYIGALTLLSLALMCVPKAHADITESFGTGTNQFNVTFVPIGNPGNAPDTTGNPNPAGSVGYLYNMGKYEVSRDMIIKANAAGNLGITLQDMTSFGGNGVNRPATGVSWNEAARYVNWLNTSKGYSTAYKFAKQPGDVGYSSNAPIQLWQLGDAGYNAANEFRNSRAKYFLPSMDEWYKAAYYDPSANGGAGGYWNFATGSDTAPTAVSGGTAAGTAVYSQPLSQGPADITNAGGLSPYGVMGMGGNVVEVEETEFDLVNDNDGLITRGSRGGGWDIFPYNYHNLSASDRFERNPQFSDKNFGFRVASIPNQILSAEITNSVVYHRSWSGIGSNLDSRTQLHHAGNVTTTLRFNNLLNSSHGINGIGFDVARLPTGAALSLQDFNFQVSPQGVFSELLNPPQNWVPAPPPSMISTSVLSAVDNLSRVIIEWPNNQIENRWLRITVKATNNTVLATPQIYYVGHLRGETTTSTTGAFVVSYAQDLVPIRLNLGTNVGPESVYDIDKNGLVQFADIVAMRSNAAQMLTQITILGSGG